MNPFVTKDYLGTLQDEMAQIQWPTDTRILLVEDNSTNQLVAQGMLEMIGLSADIANNGLEALEMMQLALEVVPYTLILMDCQMPEMDGYAASTAIRGGKAGEEYLQIPIVAMTANAMAGDREKCLISGMSDHISKPVNLAVLKTTLIQWLDGKISSAPAIAQVQHKKTLTLDAEIQELKVWDEADALKRLGGKKELLHKIMQSFLNESVRMMDALGEAIASGNITNVQLHSHSIKGSSANVSGHQVNALAKKIEDAVKHGDMGVLNEGHEALSKAMERLCDLFKKELALEIKSEQRKKDLDPPAMVIQLKSLKKEIQTGTFIDTDALDIFGEYLDEYFTVHLSRLKGSIERFETVHALDELESIISRLELRDES